jgi:hypothetical protein
VRSVRLIADLVGSELSQRLLAAPSEQQRNAAIGTATAAVLAVDLVDALVDEALGDLVQSNYSDGMRSAVAAIEEDLDKRAWDLQAKCEAGQASVDQYHAAFRQARAVAAVKTCFDQDPRASLNETIYEAAHAVDRDQRLIQLLSAILDLVAPGNRWAARDLAELFWPRFIEVDGYVLRASQYDPDNLTAWRERHPTNRSAVEDVINHVHLEDLYGGNQKGAKLTAAGQNLAGAWRHALAAQFPGRPIRVELDDSVDMTLTAFSSG